MKVLPNLDYPRIPILEPGTLGTEILQLSLDINKSQLNSVTIFNNIGKPTKDKEIVDNSRSNIKEEPIINEGGLS